MTRLEAAFAVHPNGPSPVASGVEADLSAVARRRARTLAWAGLLVNLPLFYVDEFRAVASGAWAASPAYHWGLLAWRVVAVASLALYLVADRRAPRTPASNRRLSAVLAFWFVMLGGAFGIWFEANTSAIPLYGFSLLLVAVLVHPPTRTKPLAYALAAGVAVVGARLYGTAPELVADQAELFVLLSVLSLVVDRATYRQAYRTAESARLLARSTADVERALEALREAQERLVASERQAERLRISRDLHDSVGAQLSNLLAGVELARLESGGAEALTGVEGDAREAMQQLRETVWALGSESISTGELAAQLRRFAEARRGGLRATVNATGEHHLPAAEALHLYRIGQEAIQNAVKHSGGERVRVDVTGRADGVELAVTDDGTFRPPVDGASVGAPSGFGMRTMRSRAEAMGGTLAVETDGGTTVRVVVPQSGPSQSDLSRSASVARASDQSAPALSEPALSKNAR